MENIQDKFMRHLKSGRKLHRKKDSRRLLKKSLMASLILHGRIRTTKAKAEETSKEIEKLITKAKKQSLSSFRELKKFLPAKASNKLYYEIAPLFKERSGGYTRIIKTSEKKLKDGSPVVILEFVEAINNATSKEK